MKLFWLCEESDVYGLEASLIYEPVDKIIEFHVLIINMDLSFGIKLS